MSATVVALFYQMELHSLKENGRLVELLPTKERKIRVREFTFKELASKEISASQRR